MSRGIADRFAQVLLDEGPEGYVLVESKMTRGSTHDKDRVSLTALVPAAELNDKLGDLRESQKADMVDRRAFQPDEEDE